jgi:predicted site-specific integrase-resolvase
MHRREDRYHFHNLQRSVNARFGFGYIESILSSLGTKIVTINATKEEDFQQELTQDLVSIIHHFSMKMYSNRRKILKEVEEKIKNV